MTLLSTFFFTWQDLIVRQVPHYLIIGRGRLARHFKQYFSLIAQDYSEWHRDLPLSVLHERIPKASHILILINDDAICGFIDAHLHHTNHAYLIHCSGRLITDRAIGVHPLMTFSHSFYNLSEYRAIPFVLEDDAPLFSLLFPEFTNQHTRISKKLKDKYHALCALSGNLTCYLWQHLFHRFEAELELPKEIAHPYLKQQIQNLLNDPTHALTGPLARGDHKTIEAHLHALEQDHLKAIYQGFIESFTANAHCTSRDERHHCKATKAQ